MYINLFVSVSVYFSFSVFVPAFFPESNVCMTSNTNLAICSPSVIKPLLFLSSADTVHFLIISHILPFPLFRHPRKPDIPFTEHCP